jgi:hypothetical protein
MEPVIVDRIPKDAKFINPEPITTKYETIITIIIDVVAISIAMYFAFG